jgi:uncharacterized membrane protein (DUF485 family)
MVSKETLESVLLFITILWFVSGIVLIMFTGLFMVTTGELDLASVIGFGFGIICTTIALRALNIQRGCPNVR